MKLIDLRPKRVGADMRGVCQLGALLNQIPIIPDGTPTSTYDVTDTAFKVISSVSTNSSTIVELEYGTASGVYPNKVTAAESPISATGDVNFALTGLTPFTNYYFRVKAVNSAGTAYSNEFVQRTTEPAVISDGNTVGWYDYTKSDTITKDGSNFVSQWRSRIGTNHLNQAVGTNQPLLTSDGVLGDGIDNFMKTAAFTLNQPESIYIVINPKSWTSADYSVDGNTNDSGAIAQSSSTPRIVALAGSISTAINLTLNQFSIVRAQFNGANSFLKVGTNAVTGNFGTRNMGGFTLFKIGNLESLTNFGNFEVKEIILRKVADNSTDETAIYNYLKNKYGL